MKIVIECNGTNDYKLPRADISHKKEAPSYIPPPIGFDYGQWLADHHSSIEVIFPCLIFFIIEEDSRLIYIKLIE
jgi:hypothetical protein